MQEIGQAVYGAASASGPEGEPAGTAAGGASAGGDGSTVEGEFREV